MGLEEQLRIRLYDSLDALVAAGDLPEPAVRDARITIEAPRRGGSGHVATNAALVLAKAAGRNPRELGESIARRLRLEPDVAAVELAGPGFINVTWTNAAFHAILREVLARSAAYGRSAAASRERVNVEFVSANPTGPLLISHGRGAVVGDAVARLLEVTGRRVTREYYVNDFGNQVRLLGLSVLAKARAQEVPEGGYGAGYVQELADWLTSNRPQLLAEEHLEELKRLCISLMLEGIGGSESKGIRAVLADMGIEFDVWTSEESLHRSGKVRRTLDRMTARDRLRRGEDGAVFFVTGDEDEKDRVVQKQDGTFTYFASDIAYHDDKFERGFERLLNVWGADHHGYVARLASAVGALGHDPERFEVLLFQLVSLVRNGKPEKMGKRLGNLITLQEVVEEIDDAVGNPHAGRDALRLFYLARRSDTPIVLDVELAKRQEVENPVFYMQYGYARLCSILHRAKDKFGISLPRHSESLAKRVEHPLELDLLAQLGRYPALLEDAADAREPHRIVGFLEQIAQSFQSYYTQIGKESPILPRASDRAVEGWEQSWDWEKTRGRLLWVEAIRTVYASGLAILGLSAPERMVRAAGEDDGREASS